MPSIFRGAQAQVNRSDLSGRRVWKGAAAGVDWSVWFDHFWQAKGAASYAASLLDLVGAQNLVEGAGGVPWAGGTGWGFVAAFAQWLDTGLIPVGLAWTMMIQYDNVLTAGDTLAGAFDGGLLNFLLQPNIPGNQVAYYNGRGLGVVPDHLAGNLAFSGKATYRDGLPDGNILAGGGNPTRTVIIGALHTAIISQYITAEIIAIGINTGPTLTAPQMAAAALAMSLL